MDSTEHADTLDVRATTDRLDTGAVPHPGATMRAIVQDGYGTADVFSATTVDAIAPAALADDEVLVRVHAAGLDRGTWHLMTGQPYLIRVMGFGVRSPKNPVPGLDLAGTVVAVGSKVSRWAPGDEVYGVGKGSCAELSVALEGKLARKPANLTFAQAAVVPVSGLTALQALSEAGGVTAGQKVLILGASGGVGSFAVQLAAHSGAEVTGVCSAAKAELVRSLGATHVLDYRIDDFADGGAQYDLILDAGGNASLTRLRRALTPSGTLVLIGGEDGGRLIGGFDRQLRAVAWSPFLRQRLIMLVSQERGEDLEQLTELIEAGAVVPTIDAVFPLDHMPEAMDRLAAGLVGGKVAIEI